MIYYSYNNNNIIIDLSFVSFDDDQRMKFLVLPTLSLSPSLVRPLDSYAMYPPEESGGSYRRPPMPGGAPATAGLGLGATIPRPKLEDVRVRAVRPGKRPSDSNFQFRLHDV